VAFLKPESVRLITRFFGIIPSVDGGWREVFFMQEGLMAIEIQE